MKDKKSTPKDKPQKGSLFTKDSDGRKPNKEKQKYNNKKFWLQDEDDDIKDEDFKDFLKFKKDEEE